MLIEPSGYLSQKHPLYIATVALGAFLIFLVQPLAARSLLPAFGGSASVWVTALVFYQVVLAAGYLLAHLVHTRLSIRGQTLALALLSIGSLLTLSVLPEPIAAGGGLPAWQLLQSLSISVGPPFLALAVAGPLVQDWASSHDGGTAQDRSIYSMYAISNGASLLALVGYPLLMEPNWGVHQQGHVWDGLFVVEVLLLLVISRLTWVAHPVAKRPQKFDSSDTQADIESGRHCTIRWLAWSAVGVMVLTSTSGFLGQEIAAIPMLWVVPLTLYLTTWILTFSGTVRPGIVARGSLVLAALVLMIPAVDIRLSADLIPKLVSALAGMTLACFAAHASLFQQRPEKRQLTRFYAAIAVGGAIGGIFAGVVAIQVFQDWRDLGLAFCLISFLACSELVSGLRKGKDVFPARNLSAWLILLLPVGCCYMLVVTGMDRPGLVYKHRDFHGLVRVVERGVGYPERHRLVMLHGSTVHGSQLLDPRRRGIPTTYFGRGTGAEIAVMAQRTLISEEHGLNIGVIGLGAGTMAAHLHAQDAIRFYELSPVVAELAQGRESLGNTEHHFSYLRDAAGKTEVVVGDARLSLASELAQIPGGNSFDLLVLDAFCGDAVPVHLLTQEAFSLYAAHLSDSGMIAVHVSSNWLDLVPIAYAWADSEHWRALTISTRGNAAEGSQYHSVWVLLFRNRATLNILAGQCRPLMAEGKIQVQNLRNINYGNLSPWTDDRSDLLALVRSKIRLQ